MRSTYKFINQTKDDLIHVTKDVSMQFYRRIDSFKDCSKSYRSKNSSQNKQQKEYLENYLPYSDFDSKNLIFDNKNTYAFLLRISPFSGIDRKAINVLTQVISYEIPENAVVQVINFASPNISGIVSTWQNACNKSGIYSYLSEKRKSFYLNGANPGLWGKSSDFILRDFQVYLSISFDKHKSSQANKDLLESICEIRKKTIKALNNASCFAEIIDKELFEKLFSQIVLATNFSNSNRYEYEYIMYPSYLEISNSNQNSKKYLIFEIDDLPSNWSIFDSINYTGNFDTGRGIAFPFYISYGFKMDDHGLSDRKAAKMRMLKTNQTTSKLAAFFPAMLEEVEDWYFVSGEITNGARLSKSIMHIVAIIDSSVDKKNAESTIKDHFYQLGFKINQVKYDLLNNFIASIPMSMAEHWQIFARQKVLKTLLTSNCINLLPIFADCQNYKNPLMMFSGRRGQIFFFDNFKSNGNGNYNMIVAGKSGSGKSFFLQEYMTSILRIDGQVVVIDDGRSFQNSCTILGGDFVDFAGEDFCINPFSLCLNDQADISQIENFAVDFEEPLIDLIVSILCIITNIDKNNNIDFDIGFYQNILRKAAQVVLKEKGSNGNLKYVRDVLLYDQLIRNPQTIAIADKLAYMLEEYAIGRYSRYYNGNATLSANNLLTVFELSSLESNEILQTSVLLLVIFLVYIKMQKRERRTSLIIDEAWRLLKHSAIKGFIEGIARRARKYNGNLVVATQNISDFEETRSYAAASVLSQSDFRILLSAEGKDEKILKEQLGMEKSEVEIAKNLRGDQGRYSEFIIRHSNSSWLIGRLIIDPFSSKLYSSKAEDVVAIKKMQKQGLTLEESIETLIKE